MVDFLFGFGLTLLPLVVFHARFSKALCNSTCINRERSSRKSFTVLDQQLNNDYMNMYNFLLASLLVVTTFAQYPPPQSNLTTIVSPVDGNITISYKSPPPGTCTTAFSTQQQYTGWVNIPGRFPTSTFFWFIAGRDNTSQQLTVWLNGGPGTSSLIGLFTENGPCDAIEVAQGQFGTRARDWCWDRGSNMLYLNQVKP